MATISKTVDVDIEEFSDAELLEELEYRGYSVDGGSYDLSLVDDKDLIDAVEDAGYKVFDGDFLPSEAIEYFISILPQEKIGSQEYFYQEQLRSLYRNGEL